MKRGGDEREGHDDDEEELATGKGGQQDCESVSERGLRGRGKGGGDRLLLSIQRTTFSTHEYCPDSKLGLLRTWLPAVGHRHCAGQAR